MLKVSHRTLIALGGLVWLGVGFFLLSVGLKLIMTNVYLIAGSLFIGSLKGRFVLRRAAAKQVERISTLENPTSLKNLYSKGYYLLILSMMALGFLLRLLPYQQVRGAVDIAIGAALIQGALHFFRSLFQPKNVQKT